MKLSVEAKVAAAVAAAFIAVTAAAIGQGGSEFRNSTPNNYGSAEKLNTEIPQQAYSNSQVQRTDIE